MLVCADFVTVTGMREGLVRIQQSRCNVIFAGWTYTADVYNKNINVRHKQSSKTQQRRCVSPPFLPWAEHLRTVAVVFSTGRTRVNTHCSHRALALVCEGSFFDVAVRHGQRKGPVYFAASLHSKLPVHHNNKLKSMSVPVRTER